MAQVKECAHICIRSVCVSVAILAQGTDYMLFFDGILVPAFGCNSVSTAEHLSLNVLYRYLCKLWDDLGHLAAALVLPAT